VERVALFVDAGYIFAAGAILRTGGPSRLGVNCDYVALASGLIDFVKGHSGVEMLRAYWYDGALDAVPTTDQLVIGRLPEVKLRLGRLSGGRQKGVDSLIVRDLMTLARERAIITAYLLSGDEDIREGVVAAQDLGVRVVLLGVQSLQAKQADTLMREADLHEILPNERWHPHFTAKPVQLPVQPPLLPVPVAPIAAPAIGGGGVPPSATQGAVDLNLDCFAEQGRLSAQECLAQLAPDVLELVRAQYPLIPSDLDADLLRRASGVCGWLTSIEQKKAMRAGFWETMKKPPAP
jgi:uncharacterized LabA/DUF88 family protein